MPPQKSYLRPTLWRVAFSYHFRNKNGSTSPATVISQRDIRLTLQYPLTQTGLTRLEEKLKFDNPEYQLLVLLAATPIMDSPDV